VKSKNNAVMITIETRNRVVDIAGRFQLRDRQNGRRGRTRDPTAATASRTEK